VGCLRVDVIKEPQDSSRSKSIVKENQNLTMMK